MILIMVDLPKIKKDINAFLFSEEGNISKESLLKTGFAVTSLGLGITAVAKPATGIPAAAIGIAVDFLVAEAKSIARHTNAPSITTSGDGVIAYHEHCFSTL